jgi:hypothetical protein
MSENKRSGNMRLIDADAVEKYFYEHLDDLHMAAAMNAINEMPTVDAEPVKRGEWIYDESYTLYCSHCRNVAYYSEWGAEKFDFCPYCGADMHKV